MQSGGLNAFAIKNLLNLKHNFSAEEWAVIYFHELGHLFDHSPHWRMYHEFPGVGDNHCAYDCLFHHYSSCGNIAVGREEEIFKHFTTKASAPSFRNEPINYNMHTYSGALVDRPMTEKQGKQEPQLLLAEGVGTTTISD